MLTLLTGLLLFLGIHSVSIVSEDFRDRMVAQSELGWKAVYALISILGIVLIAKGYAAARLEPVILYVASPSMRHITYLLMLPAMILFVAPYLPGKIQQITKHPQLLAVKIWAFSHLLVNGMLADVILFGAFLAWAVADRISMKKRVARPLAGLPAGGKNDLIAIGVGVVLTVALITFLHGTLTGMPLMP